RFSAFRARGDREARRSRRHCAEAAADVGTPVATKGGTMTRRHFSRSMVSCLSIVLLPVFLHAQGQRADYERADGLDKRLSGLAVNGAEGASWIGNTSRFWYRKSVAGGHEFVLVDAGTLAKRPAFDHARLAASLSKATGEKYTAVTLPFATVSFVDGE